MRPWGVVGNGGFINTIVTGVPEHDVHDLYIENVKDLLPSGRESQLFHKMVQRSGIASRYSVLSRPFAPRPDPAGADSSGFYGAAKEPTTRDRMEAYQASALNLASSVLAPTLIDELRQDITHLIVSTCTGFYAPGLDVDLVQHFHLDPNVERINIGFMGCDAAIVGLKTADYIVRAQDSAKVLMVNLELCSLHFQRAPKLERLLSFLLFADGCAASVISADPTGLRIGRFFNTLIPDTQGELTWTIGDQGFVMHLSPELPGILRRNVASTEAALFGPEKADGIALWAIHPGGRSVLDAVQSGLSLSDGQMRYSRTVLNRYGNMSSPSVMFVLADILQDPASRGSGCAMAFGPGLSVESFLFDKAGSPG